MNQFDSIMIIVPHQDDEILMTAGVIRRAAAAGIPVEIVMATNGDYGCRDFSVGRARLRETLAGLRLLGVKENQIHILGYADTGMPGKDSFLTHLYEEKDGQKIYPSFCSEETYSLEEKPEYHRVKHGKGASYCRDSFVEDLRGMIEEKKSACIITTSPYDFHGDHSALYCFVKDVLKQLKEEQGYAPALFTGLIHSCAGDDSWPKKNTKAFDCPKGLEEQTGLKWEERIVVPVPEEMKTEKGEENLKYKALCCYETALEPGAYDFLMSFNKDEEIFWEEKEWI